MHWKEKGGTWAVLGNGVDICYPSGNRALYQRILRENVVYSVNSRRKGRGQEIIFSGEHRIISGLADLVVIVEAREKRVVSLITCTSGRDQGKKCFCHTGTGNRGGTQYGVYKVDYDGAGIAYTPEVILLRENSGIDCEKIVKSKEIKNELGLATDLKLVYMRFVSILQYQSLWNFLIQRERDFRRKKVGGLLLELKNIGVLGK